MLLSAGLCISLFGGCGGGGNQNSGNTSFKNTYDVLKLGEIPIGMWVTLPDEYRTQEYFADMRACGINFINGFEYTETDLAKIKQALDIAGENDIKYLVSDPEISLLIQKYKNTKNPALINDAMMRIEQYYYHPAYAGQLLKDEPSRNEFDDMNDFVQAYELNYPGYHWSINMFPCYATGGTGVPYEQYVDDWLELVKPDYYSFDYYPLLEYDENDYFARPEREDYYYNLDLLRTKTEEKGIPYWSFIQTLGFSNTTGEGHREPSREDIRWQVFTNLAFGVKGLQYFCYYTPRGGAETFYPALIDRDGKKTERYEYVKELNADFREYGKILLRCDAEGVMVNGVSASEKRYRLYSEALTSYGTVESAEGIFLAGCFKDGMTKKNYLLITPTTPREESNVVLNMKNGADSVTLWRNNEKQKANVKDGKVEFSIGKGEAVFVEL